MTTIKTALAPAGTQMAKPDDGGLVLIWRVSRAVEDSASGVSSQQVSSQSTTFSPTLHCAGSSPIKLAHSLSERILTPQVGVEVPAISHAWAPIADTIDASWSNSVTWNTLSPVGEDAMAMSSLKGAAFKPTVRIDVCCARTSAAAAEGSNPTEAAPSVMTISTLGIPASSARACASTVLFTSSRPREVNVAAAA